MSTDEMKPLKRLLDDPEISGDLRADLLTAQSFHVPFDAAAGLSRFQAHLDSLGGAPEPSSGHAAPVGGATAPSAALQLTGGKILAALALAAGLGWGALELSGGAERKTTANDAATPPAAPVVAQNAGSQNPGKSRGTSEAPAPLAPAAPAPGQAVETAAQLALAPQRARATTRLEHTQKTLSAQDAPVTAPAVPASEVAQPSVVQPVAPDSAAPSAADRLAKEVAQLSEVRRALSTDPARALALANQGHAEFADGAMRQEREALALSALEKLGNRAALSQRGAAFLKRYPQSSFAPQVKRMLGQ